MKFVRSITWQEIFQFWKETEAGYWEEYYRSKGFNTWEDYRNFYVRGTGAVELKWGLFQIDPSEVLQFRCGGYHGWLKNAEQLGSRTFGVLANHKDFKNNGKILILKKNFPAKTQLIGFRRPDSITIFEGNHRCVSIAQMIQAGIPLNSEIFIALADLDPAKEYPFVDYDPRDRTN